MTAAEGVVGVSVSVSGIGVAVVSSSKLSVVRC
jgi:hypothetical protein